MVRTNAAAAAFCRAPEGLIFMDDILPLLDKVEVLPPSPSLLPRLLPALMDVDANFDEVVEMIALDPALTAKLLQICNSAFFGATEPVTNVRDAVSQAGYQAIYLLAAMISSGDCFQMPASASLDGKRLWKHSVTAAYGAKFAAESAGAESGLLFTAGLLHDIGKVVLIRAHGEEYGLLRLRALQTGASPLQAEIKRYDYSHAEVGACLLGRWQLPAPLVAAVRFHHNPSGAGESQRLAACVCLGNYLAHTEEQSAATGLPDFKSALALLNLEAGEVDRWRQRIREYRSLMEMMCRMPA
jgi:putative nucleotidyltransferase with HDIG domain